MQDRLQQCQLPLVSLVIVVSLLKRSAWDANRCLPSCQKFVFRRPNTIGLGLLTDQVAQAQADCSCEPGANARKRNHC